VIFPKELGVCTVTNRFMTDNSTADGIPSAGDVAAVQAFLVDNIGAGVDITTFAPVTVPTAYDISLSPSNDTVKAAVKENLKDLHLRVAEPGKGIAISKIRQAISNAEGEDDSTVNVPAAGVPAGAAGDIPTFGSVVFS